MPRSIRVLDTAPLARKGVVVLELDAPSPLLGVAIGMAVDLICGTDKERVVLKGIGFASSTPDHAHIIVSAPSNVDVSRLERIEIDAPE